MRSGGNDTHIVPVLPECARGKRKDEGCWPLMLAQRARMMKLIVTLWAVLVEARGKRPISLVAERISSRLGRTIYGRSGSDMRAVPGRQQASLEGTFWVRN